MGVGSRVIEKKRLEKVSFATFHDVWSTMPNLIGNPKEPQRSVAERSRTAMSISRQIEVQYSSAGRSSNITQSGFKEPRQNANPTAGELGPGSIYGSSGFFETLALLAG